MGTLHPPTRRWHALGLAPLAILPWVTLEARATSVLQFVVPDYVVSPGPSTYIAVEGFPDVAAVFVQRTGDLGSTVGVEVATAGDTALPGVDYTETATNLVFLAGETGKTVLIPILNDQVAEPYETFRVTLSNPTGGAVLGGTRTAKVRITDNDDALQVELAD